VVVIGSAGLLVGSLSLLAVGTVTPVALLVVAAETQVSSHVKPRIRGRSIEAATRQSVGFRRPGGPLAAPSWGSVSADVAAHREL
jgi:hypothetical protein